MFRSLLLVLSFVALGGCKLALMVSSGGDVSSVSGTRDCPGGSYCEFNIVDSTFDESFTAAARPGYEFVKWSAGDGFLCGNSTNPTCVLSNLATAGIPAADVIFASGQINYAVPIFNFVGIDTDNDGIKDYLDEDDDNDGILDIDDLCPLDPDPSCGFISDTITVDGKEWAQVDLFNGVSWKEISAACPAGVCSGVLNGWSVAGWTWASVDDANALFNHYIPGSPLGPGPDEIFESATTWGVDFFADGWRPNDAITIRGALSDPFYGASLVTITGISGAGTNRVLDPDENDPGSGVWLFTLSP